MGRASKAFWDSPTHAQVDEPKTIITLTNLITIINLIGVAALENTNASDVLYEYYYNCLLKKGGSGDCVNQQPFPGLAAITIWTSLIL